MENVRQVLQQELVRRISRNPSYSLRAFAGYLGISHATLSRVLSGKRNMSDRVIEQVSNKLGLSPTQIASMKKDTSKAYLFLQEDIFNSIAEWYYDAILELVLIKGFEFTPENIGRSLGITEIQAKDGIETLERRLHLISKDGDSYKITAKFSTNELDSDTTNAAKIRYQKSILEKSMVALESTPRSKRDHTSTTMAIKKANLPEVKNIIKRFRKELNEYLQGEEQDFDEIYQLQVSFFPLSNLN